MPSLRTPRRWTARLVIVLTAALLTGALTPPLASARVGLIPGTKLYFVGGGSCSLGFFATNNARDRLAVTAGHCAHDVDQKVTDENGDLIGEVVHLTEDDLPNRKFGVALIQLYDNAYISDPYFTKFGNPAVGDYVKKYGARTAKTQGSITSIDIDDEYPQYSRMESTMVGIEGDSGSAWVGTGDDGGPQLLGLNIGYTKRADGGYGYALGFPIRSLIKLVRRNSKIWGPGFTPTGP